MVDEEAAAMQRYGYFGYVGTCTIIQLERLPPIARDSQVFHDQSPNPKQGLASGHLSDDKVDFSQALDSVPRVSQ